MDKYPNVKKKMYMFVQICIYDAMLVKKKSLSFMYVTLGANYSGKIRRVFLTFTHVQIFGS